MTPPTLPPFIWLLGTIIMLLKWIFVDCWFIWVILSAIWIIYNLIKSIIFGFCTIKKKKQAKAIFLDFLVHRYCISFVDDAIKLRDALSVIIQRMSCDNTAICSFDKIFNEFNSNHRLLSATVSTGYLDSKITSINGTKLHVHNECWAKVDSSVKSFCLKWKTGCLCFYPYFCIIETPDKIELIEWKDVKVSSTKGEPAYHSYLHERIGGGPDKRYKYNPLIPVYIYSALVFNIAGDTINLILQGEDEAERVEKIFREYKKILALTGGVSMSMDIQSHDD